MTPSFATITAETTVAGPPAAVFQHWIAPESRQRWEAPPESGMRYLNFASGPGEVEVIEITHDGQVIGAMDQTLVVIEPPRLIVSQIVGTFHGTTSLIMQVVMRFEEVAEGTRLLGTSQVSDLSGRDVQAEHEAGWAALYKAFADDFRVHWAADGGVGGAS